MDWERDRIRIHNPKTEHHDGGESLLISLFPELRTYLEQCWEEAEPGSDFVVTRYRSRELEFADAIIVDYSPGWSGTLAEAVSEPTRHRKTELTQSFSLHVVCARIDNSTTVATKHYLQVTDEHFRDAITSPPCAAQHAHATGRAKSKAELSEIENLSVIPGFTADCNALQFGSMPPQGLEP